MNSSSVIGVCSWSLRAADPGRLVSDLRQTGLKAVQLALNPLVDDSGAGAGARVWADAPQILAEAGVRIVSGMMATRGEDYSTLASIRQTGGVRPDKTWPANQELAQRVADCAAQLALPLVTFHAGFLPENEMDDERDRMIDRIRWLAELFSERGIETALETGQETASTLGGILRQLDHPGVGVNFDPANMILYGMGDPVNALRELGPWVRQVHIKDALPSDAPGQWGEEVPVGRGAVDWKALFDVIGELPREVDLIIERESGEVRIDDIRAAAALVGAHLPRLKHQQPASL